MKVLLYGYTRLEFEAMDELKAKLEQRRHEVAHATANRELLPWMTATKKYLVVRPETYGYDVIISMNEEICPVGETCVVYSGQEVDVIERGIAQNISSNNNI